MDVGGALRDAREQRGLSLDQLAQATKIRVTTLQAIETNQREKLPEAIFLRGFVRAYAREVGLNSEDTVRRYLAQFEPVTDIVERAGPEIVDTPREHTQGTEGATNHHEAERRVTRVQWLGVVMLVIGVAAYCTAARWRAPALGRAFDASRDAPEIARPSSSGGSPTTAAVARVEAPTTGSGELIVPANDLLHLGIQAQGLCWLSATVDGTRVVYRLMQPGEQHSIEVHDEAVLRVGDPAAFAFSIDGLEGPSLGRPGDAVTVHITKQNYREFLRR